MTKGFMISLTMSTTFVKMLKFDQFTFLFKISLKEQQMPIYEYICDKCSHELEEMQKFNDPPLAPCPQCGEEELRRKLSVGAFHLKGGGWYKDGYKGQSNKTSEDTKSETSSTKDATSSSSDKKASFSNSSTSSPATSEKSTAS